MTVLAGTRILIAEDERAVRMLIRFVLELAGATVVEAEHGGQALRLLELDHDGFDLVLSDVNMPEMSGAELVDAIRTRWGERLPVVLCTAINIAARSPALMQRVHATVTKPFAPSELVQACANAIAQARTLRRAAV